MNALLLAIHLSCGLNAGAAACDATHRPRAALSAGRRVVPPQDSPRPPADKWFGPDKLQHFTLSYGVTAFGFAGAQVFGAEGDSRLRIGASAALLAGLAKELADVRRGYGFSIKDLIYDTLGVAAAWVILKNAR